METLLIVFQIILAILIVLIVLVNVTKGSEYGAVFRGAEAIFGGAGPTSFLNKVTMLLVILFFVNSLLLTKISTAKHKIMLPEKLPAKESPQKTQPPVPALPPVPPQNPPALPPQSK
ncbi:preprotein translocase subunit SecG [Caldimicrobium thiodismutans]|jgi:preprotein translocase subunit SecG|uniref:Protein-export membrane protein SecG n=1 Tax=Caldimicrobium thiodismutans TaxID=1653476 RepID=A0A0U5AVC0_9BACT|nr:preprotein translocase subunit SecG [Caldimicrobium thiodismutans]BAU23208.1 preprotein translocase subunit SecG [Caldimicrobium thiodismutans]